MGVGTKNGGTSCSRGQIWHKMPAQATHCLACPLLTDYQAFLMPSVLMCERDYVLQEAQNQGTPFSRGT